MGLVLPRRQSFKVVSGTERVCRTQLCPAWDNTSWLQKLQNLKKFERTLSKGIVFDYHADLLQAHVCSQAASNGAPMPASKQAHSAIDV
jgi:hypothetical protein